MVQWEQENTVFFTSDTSSLMDMMDEEVELMELMELIMKFMAVSNLSNIFAIACCISFLVHGVLSGSMAIW